MADRLPEFEGADKKGSSDPFVGTVGTSWTAIPNVAGGDIQEFIISHEIDDNNTSGDRLLSVSFDNRTTTLAELHESGSISGIIKNTQTQIYIKSTDASTPYRVILMREPS